MTIRSLKPDPRKEIFESFDRAKDYVENHEGVHTSCVVTLETFFDGLEEVRVFAPAQSRLRLVGALYEAMEDVLEGSTK